jgi:gamma-glutamyltranspeptidase / glutathione hydrolase
MLMMLNVLAGFDISLYSPLSTERFHREAETSRHAFIAREQHVGDPRFANVDVEALLSDAFASGIRSQISLDHICSLPPSAAPMHPSTVYLCVVDRDRNVCSFVNSIAYSFGSGIVGSRSGVLLQNRGAGFRSSQLQAPGKRPLHTLLAALVTKDGRAILPFGVMGGAISGRWPSVCSIEHR